MKKLVISRKVFASTLSALDGHFSLHSNQDDTPLGPSELAARAKDAEAIFVVSSDKVDKALLDACPKLKIVATGSVGFNHIDLAECKARGIAVTTTPDVLTEATADQAWALLMAAARRVTEAESWLRAGKWDRWAFDQFLGQDVHGATLGIIGMGRIGSAVAKRGRGFDMKVLYANRSVAANEKEIEATRVGMDELLKQSDFVVLVLPYSKETHHLIGAAQLALMKRTAVLVNIARGGIVDDEALAQALKAGTIFSAGLDVFEGEPKIHTALLECTNIAMAPHLGSATQKSREAMAMLAAKNLVAWVKGEPLLTQLQ